MDGHPEATVADHIKEVLGNVEIFAADPVQRGRLRLVALTHDTFKHRVHWFVPWRQDHAKLARRFAERHVSDPGVLEVVSLHDEAYRAWRHGRRTGDWPEAERRAKGLVAPLRGHPRLFMGLFLCGNETGGKTAHDPPG